MKAPALSAEDADDAIPAGFGFREIWSRPMPHLRHAPLTRFFVRSVISLSRKRIVDVRGLEHVDMSADPFIFVSNHNQRLEAVLVPALLIDHRQGKLVHFMADWPTMMVPLAGMMLRCGEVIPVTRKNARWRFLNAFKSRFEGPETAFEQAARKLREGAPVGIFPEATMNRDPRRLLRGQVGAARLAVQTGVPVVPAGIRFPTLDGEQPIRDRAPMLLEIGEPIRPPASEGGREAIRDFHARIMGEISRLSGKAWHPKARRRK